jgi:NitT/TauT family transport system substrate-binding protein
MMSIFARAALACALLLSTPAWAEKVVIAYATSNVSFSTFYVAHARGYFKKFGLDTDVQLFGSGAKGMAAVIGGGADVYVGSVLSLPNARKQGADLVAFGSVVNQLVAPVVVSKKWAADHNLTEDTPYPEKLKALKGIRAAIAGPGSGPDQVMRYLAREGRLDPERDMQLVNMSADMASNISAMDRGAIDAIVLGSPVPELARKNLGAVTLIDFSKGHVPSMKDFPYGAVMAKADWLKANPATAAKITAGLQMALESLRNPQENAAAKAVLKGKYLTPMSDDILDEAWASLPRTIPQSVEFTKPMMVRVLEFTNLFEQKKADPNTADQYFTNEYALKGLELVRSGAMK